MMNQKKNRHNKQLNTGASRRSKATSSQSDDIFISGPVQYQPPPNSLTSNASNFVSTAQNSAAPSMRSRHNAWANTRSVSASASAGTSSSTATSSQSASSNASSLHTSPPDNDNNKSSNGSSKSLHNNHCSTEFPSLTESKSNGLTTRQSNTTTTTATTLAPRTSTHANGNATATADVSSHSLKAMVSPGSDESKHTNTSDDDDNPQNGANNKSSSSASVLEQRSAWLQYDEEAPMDDFELSLSTPHRSIRSLHAVAEHSQREHEHEHEPQEEERPEHEHKLVSPTDHALTPHARFPSSSRGYQSRRQTHTSTPPIHVDPDSFQRQEGHGNGYYEQSQHKHAAVLDDYRRSQPPAAAAAARRRSTQYTVEIRGSKRGDHEHAEPHWSQKQRFVPNGEITNFVPEHKPLRRPSYLAHLQANKDREKRDEEQLTKFHADRLRYMQLHAEQWMNKLRHKQLEKEQQEVQLQQQQQQAAAAVAAAPTIAQSLQSMSMMSGVPAPVATMAQPPPQQQRAPNQSRTNYLFGGQPMAAALNAAASKPSPPAALNVNMLTGTPPLNALSSYPLVQYSMSQKAQTPTLPELQQRLQQQTQQMLNTKNAAAQLNVTSAPYWNAQQLAAARSPTTDAHSNQNVDTKSSTVTPQTNPLVHTTMPESINLSEVNHVASFAGHHNHMQQTLQRTQQQQQQPAINLMGTQMGFPHAAAAPRQTATAAAPIQFSQQLYHRQAMLNAQRQQQQQIWLQQQQVHAAQQQQQQVHAAQQAAAAAAQQQQQRWNASPALQPANTAQIQYAQDFEAMHSQPGMYAPQWNPAAQHNQWPPQQNQPQQQNWNQYGSY